MRKIKPEYIAAKERGIVVLRNIPHQGLVKANRLLLLVASSLMVVVFILGFLLMPEGDVISNLKAERKLVSEVYTIQNPVVSAEINALKGQLVGLISGSIDSKLRSLESSIRSGSVSDSLGTIQGLKSDVKILQQAYLSPKEPSQGNQALLQEVSQLKKLIYFTLTSCGLLIAAIAGFLVRKHYFITTEQQANKRAALGRGK